MKEKVKVYFANELANKPEEVLQEILNRYIAAGFIPPDTTLDNVGFSMEDLLEEQLNKINKRMFSLPNLVWDSEYHVDEEATSKVCPEYTRLAKEYERLATELNTLKNKRLGFTK